MIDLNFYEYLGQKKLSDIIKELNQKTEHQVTVDYKKEIDDNIVISGVSNLDSARKQDIAVFHNDNYLKNFAATNAICCVVKKDFKSTRDDIILIRTENPYFIYSILIGMFYAEKSKKLDDNSYISPKASISSSAKIGKNVTILDGVSIEDDVEIGDNSIIEQNTVIKHGVTIGKNERIASNVSIRYSIIGDDVVILDGAKIGHEGFGFATEKGIHYRIFHFGKVIIGNDVEIGANTTIDRGSSSDTVIEDFCRIGNLTLIAHNVRIGKGSVLVGHIAIAGSSKIGRYCVLGGQVGVSGHLNIADMTTVAAQSGIVKNVDTKGQTLAGMPAVPIKDWHRQNILLKNMINKKDWIK
jgi:UDP-3-O-[3-hydroxymyristoyl] glucosamine N-acyltransferase